MSDIEHGPAPDPQDESEAQNQNGGINISGDAAVGGDLVGRDKIVHDSHDQIQAGGDVISIGPGARNVAVGKNVSQRVSETGAAGEPSDERPSRSAPEGNPLGRLWARLRGKTSGDRVVVGEGAQNVAVGRFILQTNVRIGTLVIPARLVLALVAVGVVLAVAAWFAFVPSQMPINTFNIAVARFGKVNAQGEVVASQDGAALSEWMYGQLRDEALVLPTDRPIEVWHDSMSFLAKRASIGVIADERAAAELARAINAHMVIYGNLALNQTPETFTPEFYVAELTGEADELLGSQQLGAPIPVQPPIDFNNQLTGEYFNRNLQPRAEALVWFTRGLVYDLSGQHDKALEVFRQAETALRDWDTAPCVLGQPNASQGKEVLYYFIGREALYLSRNEAEARKAFDSVDAALAAAESAFRTALTIRCDYARAHLGLGNMFMLRAQQVLIARQFDAASLERARQDADAAIEQQNEALRTAALAPGSGVAIKAQVNLGMATFMKAQTFQVGNDHAAALPLYQLAVNAIQSAISLIDPDDHRSLAQTYHALGAVYRTQAHSRLALGETAAGRALIEQAIANYTQCIAQAEAQIYDAFLQEVKTRRCEPDKADAQAALDSLGP